MKKIFFLTISVVGQIMHILIPFSFVKWCKIIFGMIYSEWIRHEFCKCGKGCSFGYFSFLRGAKYICIGNNTNICQDVVIEVYDYYQETKQRFIPNLTIGNGSQIGDNSHITCINRIVIGNHVLMGRKVFITDNAHGYSLKDNLDLPPKDRPMYSKGQVVIEDNVWIGEMVSILPGVTIGYGSIIGANSVVTHDVPPYSVVGGNPAKVIKKLIE